MKRISPAWFAAVASLLIMTGLAGTYAAWAEGPTGLAKAAPDEAAIARARKTIQMLDDIYKKTIVMITDKYVHTTEDFAAGSAAVLLFEQVSESGTHQVRLLDATGMPYDTENVARDDFEKEAIKRLKEGAKSHEEVVQRDGQAVLRMVTPVPVVLDRCIMCHDHYADAAEGEPVGAISYALAIE